MSSGWRYIGVSVACVLGACSFEIAQPEMSVANSCSRQSDCPGATCEEGMCVAAVAPALAITLEVEPIAAEYGLEPPTIVLPAFALLAGDERDVMVPAPITLVGRVRALDEIVPATLRFVPVSRGALAGGATSVNTANAPGVAPADEDVDFSASLVSETTYRVIVTPLDRAALPPLKIALTTTEERNQRLDVSYDEPTFATQALRLSNLPAGTWSVVAIDADTGDEISTRATADAQTPVAVLRSVQPLEGFDVLVTPVLEVDAQNNVPTFRMPAAMLSDAEPGVLKVELPVLDRAVDFNGTVEHCRDLLMEPEVDSRPALAVALRSQSLLGSDGASHALASLATTATATFDRALREWSFSTQVPAGEYDVVVIPGADSGCGVFAERRAIVAPASTTTTGALLQLPALSFLAGTVRASGDGTPVTGATVAANALGLRDAIALEATDDSVTRYNRSQQSTTDAAGEFVLPIDVGSYDVLIKSPAESGFAWHVVRDVNVGARTDTPFEREIEMAPPVVLRGTLRTNGASLPMEGATVRAYTTVDDAERGQRALPMGTAMADRDGGFMLLLPSTIDHGWY